METLNLQLRGNLSWLYEETKVCLGRGRCYGAEPDLDLLMRTSRDPGERLAAWRGLRDALGPSARTTFTALIAVENQAARAAGYSDIGQCWREELETPNLPRLADKLFEQIAPLYRLLHGFVRYHLRRYYGERLVPQNGPIPAHFAGDMWSSSWDSLMDVISPSSLGLNAAVRRLFPSARAMLSSAEDFYHSLGLPRMSKTFWKESIVGDNATGTSCHGTAANMFRRGDVRMLLCSGVSWEDFYVVHHEMGHIQYFMAYENQPAIFQDAPNSAFHEAIGDTVMLSVGSATHLQRLGILRNVTFDEEMSLMLTLALNKIPQLAYGLILDKWRWDVMSSKVTFGKYNELWWAYRRLYQGLAAPVARGNDSLDPIAKFHVTDNTPYIRYFLSGFLQFQLLDILCEGGSELHRCDLYGNKAAGHRLSSLMAKGSEASWQAALEEMSSGKYSDVSAEPLLRYFSPLAHYLSKQMNEDDIPRGW